MLFRRRWRCSVFPHTVPAEEPALAGPYDFASAFVACPGFSEDTKKESWFLAAHEICTAEDYLSEGQKLNGFYLSIQGKPERRTTVDVSGLFLLSANGIPDETLERRHIREKE